MTTEPRTDQERRALAAAIANNAFLTATGGLAAVCAELEETYTAMKEGSDETEPVPGAWRARIRAVMGTTINRRLGGLADLGAPVTADQVRECEGELLALIELGKRITGAGGAVL